MMIIETTSATCGSTAIPSVCIDARIFLNVGKLNIEAGEGAQRGNYDERLKGQKAQ